MPESLLDVLPAIYQRLLPAELQSAAPDETRATCSSCAMCPPPGTSASSEQVFFSPALKCCTYHPTLPNYLVGALLRDSRSELADGQERIRARIAGRVGVTPRWLAAPLKYRMLHRVSRTHGFGRSEELLCPYYAKDSGGCSIWAYRESTCSTFFCKYDDGADGQVYWRAVLGYLSRLEIVLSEWLVQRLGSVDMVDVPLDRKQLTREELEERPPAPADYQSWWRDWEGREEAFYLAAAEEAETLDLGTLTAVWGDEEAQRRLEIQVARDKIEQGWLPQHLMLSPKLLVINQSDGMALVRSYNDYDPAIVPQDLLEVLSAFQGDRTVSEVRAHLEDKEGITLADELISDLFQRRILTAG